MAFLVIGVLAPLIFFIYNVICYFNKKVIYTIKSDKFIVINNTFYSLQLMLSCINCVLLFVLSFLLDYVQELQLNVICYLLIFWVINYFIKGIAILMKYAKIQS